LPALKRRSLSLEHDLRTLAKASPKSSPPAAEDPDAVPRRFSAKGLASQRKRLGLSADAVGLLIGTTGQSIYNWEAGKARPRQAHLAAIAALKTLSKKTAAEVLASRTSAT
jgi:DNA-binding transcriptional regulator YiaG